ncbi:hypothetical protein K491DRAFT_709989 [Lophiostoma macrostomum CBS 122681]|uniref:SPRY domain-containing protein n=1 Tax=Lophiostoma macrostomum CBS 122681 TaxID=1314788 RepID=A0A6A6TRH2_9PLEO|nr:hypothetical protein K491DRAFT_709989 [Lophiostoma macrostomum CBS 122681]
MRNLLPGKEEQRQEEASSQQSQLHPNNPWYQPQAQPHNTGTHEKYQPPPGPPPSSFASSSAAYAPPPGPPPKHTAAANSSSGYAPPSQPPPSWEPPPYHDWTQIPDNSLLPPPPSIGYESSHTANASPDDGARAYAWCNANPLWPPQNVDPQVYSMIQNYQLNLLKPPTYQGSLRPQQHAGHWKCNTESNNKDSCLLTNLPMYAEMWDSPLRTQRPKTIYFEIKIVRFVKSHGWRSSNSESDPLVAIGFVAPPFPTWRLPGWQRGSLGVHSDDGHKYVNNTFGGADFTNPFAVNDVVGIGITFAPPKSPPAYGQPQEPKLDIEVFFTRNGVKEGGWDGNQELDAEMSEGGTIGLCGDCDLFPAIGTDGGLEFEVFFTPELWLYNPF